MARRRAKITAPPRHPRQPLSKTAKSLGPNPTGPRLPREIMTMIYLYVKDADDEELEAPGGKAEARRTGMRLRKQLQGMLDLSKVSSSDMSKRPPCVFPLLALVDRWSCEFIARCLYRSEMTIEAGDTFLHRLIRISPVDAERAESANASANASATWSDEHVYPYLRRYHQLRRISHITIDDDPLIDASLSALPDQRRIEKFLKHIGEPGPLFRNVHLDISNAIHLSISPPVRRPDLQSLKTLFLPKSVMLTGSDVPSTVYQTANALSKIWPDVPIRVMMPQTLPLDGCIIPSPSAWLNYIVGFLDQPETTHPSSTSKPKLPRPSIDAVIAVIRKQLIARARLSRVSLDFQFPYHDPACLAQIMRAVVDVEVKDAIEARETPRTDRRGSRAAVLKGLRLFGADGREFQA